MNMKLGKTFNAVAVTTLLLGSFGAFADTASDDTAVAIVEAETRDQAQTANREAVKDALVRISAATRLDLEVELPTRTTTVASGD